MLIPMLSPILLFTNNKRFKKPAHNPNKPPQKDKRGSRAYFEETEDGRQVQIDRGVAARDRKGAAAREKAEAEFAAYDRAKKARYENLSIVVDMGKVEFRCMREQPFFNMPQTSTNHHFWRREQELVMM